MCRQKFPFLYHPCNCNCLHPTKFKAFLTWLKTWGPLGVGRRHLHRYHHHQHRHHCSHRRRHEESKGIAFYIKTREDSQSLSLFHPTTALGSDNDRDTIVQELLENHHRRPSGSSWSSCSSSWLQKTSEIASKFALPTTKSWKMRRRQISQAGKWGRKL